MYDIITINISDGKKGVDNPLFFYGIISSRDELQGTAKEGIGRKHSDTITAMSNLASSLRDVECFEEVLTLDEKVL